MKYLVHSTAYSVLFFVALFAILYAIFSYGPSDSEQWEKMQVKSQRVKNREYLAKQERQTVRKDVLLVGKGEGRLQMRILGDSSQLLLDNRNGGEGLVENIKNASCLMQEELLKDGEKNPVQIIRYFAADHAKYHNRQGSFSAKDVEVFRYLLSGHDLPTTTDDAQPLMEGLAESVEIFVREKNGNFTAKNFHAALHNRSAL